MFQILIAVVPWTTGLGCCVTAVAIAMLARKVACGLVAKGDAVKALARSRDPELVRATAAWRIHPDDGMETERLVVAVRTALACVAPRRRAWVDRGLDQDSRAGRRRYLASLVSGVDPGVIGLVLDQGVGSPA